MVYIFPFSSSHGIHNKHSIRSPSSYSRARETNNELCQSRTVTPDYFHVSVEREKCRRIIRATRGGRGNLAESKLVRVGEEEE